ncbi:Scr1 family TA system antitoxin-like transcriptional regulator [Nocardia terpenica]
MPGLLPLHLDVLLRESVLHTSVGGHTVTATQAEYLAECGKRPPDRAVLG